MSDSLTTHDDADGVVRIQLDDGKANALSPALVDAISRALDAAEKDGRAVVLAGRPGRFCAGFDLSVMGSNADAARSLVHAGAELCVRLLEFPRPVVIACTGHAVAGGALLVMSGDYRIGARGAFKIGLNEVAIGMTLPHFGREIARSRISKRHLDRIAVHSEMVSPEGALDAGVLDALADPDALLDAATEHAQRLCRLDARAFEGTKSALHSDLVALIRAELDSDLLKMMPPG